jgi:hypothetical protein
MDREPAHVVDELCARELGAGVARELFCHVGSAVVYGLELSDGRRVVVKAHPPGREPRLLHEIIAVQNHLASRGLYAPTVVGGPLALGPRLCTVEALLEGERRDASDPLAQRLVAEALVRVVAACQPLAASSASSASSSSASSASSALAVSSALPLALAPAGMLSDTPSLVHGDWTVTNARFCGSALVVAYGWGNLQRWLPR